MPNYQVGERGEYAARPSDIPRRGWVQVLKRVMDQIEADHLSVVSAGVAFYGLLSLFPGTAVLVTLYGLFADPLEVRDHLDFVEGFMPADAYQIISDQLEKVTGKSETKLGLGLLLSIGLALWSSMKGTRALITAMNIAYNESEKRGIIMLTVTAVIFTFGAAVYLLLSIVVIAAIPAAIELFDMGPALTLLLSGSRWLVMIVLFAGALAVLYRYGPSRSNAKLQWITPGAIAATIIWVLTSIAFSLYIANFGNYNETFGSLGAVVILLMWFYLSAFVVCLGAELNAELEHQTCRDSTTGPARPAGSRGAFVADHMAGDSS